MRDGYRCEKDQGRKSCKKVIHGRKIRSEEVEKVLCMRLCIEYSMYSKYSSIVCIEIRKRRRINSSQSEKRKAGE